MTIKELKEKMHGVPDNMDVMIEKVESEFEIALAERAEVKNVLFRDGKGSHANEMCFVITDEI